MRRPRLSSLAPCLSLALSIASANPVHAQAVSLWDLNTSTMALYADGRSVVFRYREPRVSLQDEGVVPGTLHFAGTVAGNVVSGTAHVFSRRCGPQPYHVTGTVSEHSRTITLTGIAPSGFDAACQAVRFREAVLVFNLLQVIPQAPPVVVGSIDRDQTAAQEQLESLRRQRDEEQRRLSELRAFSNQRAACQRYDIQACDLALRSAHASPHDAAELARWRTVAEQFRTDRHACRAGTVAACDAALSSPALSQNDRPLLTSWRTAASPTHRILAGVAAYAETSVAVIADALVFVRNLPASTHLAGGVATIFGLVLAGLAVRHRRTAAAEPGTPATGHLNDRTTPAASPSPSSEQQSHHTAAKVAGPPPIPNHPAQLAPPAHRDTPGALAALELACAYLQEVRDADRPAFDDTNTRKHHLNTLALAAKQLDHAQLLDPDAVLEGQDEKDVPYRLSINELKAETLVLEGTTHQTYDTRRAIPALRKATEVNPNNAAAFYILGLIHAANMHKREAVAAFERAVALDPQTIAYRKELNRVQNLSAGEIAAYKTTRAGEKIFDAGVATANAGITTWNIFAVLWNIVTFPLRVVFGIFRLLRLFPFG